MRCLKSMRNLVTLLLVGVACTALATNIGPDDLQISFTGATGTPETDAHSPSVAFDTHNKRFLVVWSADETDGGFRIMGRLLTGGGGTPLGDPFPTGFLVKGADQFQPAVAYSPQRRKYLVVWSGDSMNLGAREIMGQFLDGNGVLQGPMRRFSDMGGGDADTRFDAVTPDVAWNSHLDVFTVVWAGDDDAGSLGDGRFEVYGQHISGSTELEVGTNDFRITYSLDDRFGNDVLEPALAVVADSDRWFVAFEADADDDGVHDPEIWMYGCNGDIPDESGFNVSLMGGDHFDGLSARNPDLVYVPSLDELLCVWDGEDGSSKSPAIFGRRVSLAGDLLDKRFNFSTGAGGHLGDLRAATHPAVVVDPTTDEWFVTWQGDADDGLPHRDYEIWARRFDDSGTGLGTNPFRLSDMDPSFEPVAGAGPPAVALNTDLGYKMVAWSGDLDTTPGGEHEIFVQGWSDDALSPATRVALTSFALHGAAPNPFNPSTTIAFDLPGATTHSLRIFDAAGRLVRTLRSDAPGLAGRNEVVWDGRDGSGRPAASGVYLYKLDTPTDHDLGRMTLVK